MEREPMADSGPEAPRSSLTPEGAEAPIEPAGQRYIRLLNTNPATLNEAERAAYPGLLESTMNEVGELFNEAKEKGLLEDVDKSLNDIHDTVRYKYKSDPVFAGKVLAAANGTPVPDPRFRDIDTGLELEMAYWDTFGEDGDWGELSRLTGVRAAYFNQGVHRIAQESLRVKGGVISDGGVELEGEWNIKERPEPKLWDRTEFNTLIFKREMLRNRGDLEKAFRQFIRQTLSTGTTTVDQILGDMEPLQNLVLSEAYRLGLRGKIPNRLRAEAGGRLLLFAADWFARIGKRQEVQKLMGRYTDDTTEKTLGLALSYDGRALEAGSLLTLKGDEGLIGLTPEMPLYQEFQALGIYHPEKLKFIDYYRLDGPSGELYNDKVKGEKFQELIKRALVNKLVASSIVSKNESGNEDPAVKEANLNLAALGLRGEAYEDISDREFMELFSQTPADIEELNTIIDEAMQAYYEISVMVREERVGVSIPEEFVDSYRAEHPGIDLSTPEVQIILRKEYLKVRKKAKDEKMKAIDRYEDRVDEAKEAANIAMHLFTSFGFSSELLCPRIWKRESITYEPDNLSGKYVFDEEEDIYVYAMRTFKLKNGKLQLDEKTGLPKEEFEYDPSKPRFRKVQGDYARDEDGHKILISIEDEVRERLGYDANNNNSFFPLDDRSRTVFLKPEYPNPAWMKEYLKHIDPNDFMRYVSVLPEQRDLLIRKVGEDWKRYIRTHRQLMIDYAQDAIEYEGADLRGTIPPEFIDRYTADHPGMTPEAIATLENSYLEYVREGFKKEIGKRVYEIPGMFAYQQDIIYGGGAPFAIKKDEYLSWWVLGDPIQNAQKTEIRSITFASLLDTGVRSVARKYMGGPYFRRFIQGLALRSKEDAIILDDYETQIWVGEFGGADDLRLAAVGRDTERGYQSGFMHSFIDKKEELKNTTVLTFYNAATQPNEANWKIFSKEQQYKLLLTLLDVFNRQFSFAVGYLVHNERTSVPEEGKWLATRFMNGVFDLAGSEYGHYAYPDSAYILFIVLNKVRLSEFQNKTVRDVLLDLYVKNYK